jgi:hypothetical protein
MCTINLETTLDSAGYRSDRWMRRLFCGVYGEGEDPESVILGFLEMINANFISFFTCAVFIKNYFFNIFLILSLHSSKLFVSSNSLLIASRDIILITSYGLLSLP